MIELRHQYPLAGLLKLADLARSTFYYQQKALQVADKYADLKARIKTIFDRHKGRYGYWRSPLRFGKRASPSTTRRSSV